MSRKRGKKTKAPEAVPDEVLAEGSGPLRRTEVDAIATVEDVVTTDDIATTEDVVTADDVVATAVGSRGSDPRHVGEPFELTDPPFARDELSGHATGSRLGDDVVVMMAGNAGGSDAGSGDAPIGDDDRASAAPEAELADDSASPGAELAGDAVSDEDDAGVVFPTSAATMDAVQLKHLVEALIFASDRPLTVQRLRQLARVGDVRRLEQALAELADDYRDRGLILQQVSGGYQFRTRTQFSAWVQQLIAGRPVRLSRAQLETLAIIAYRQPITRPEIDDIRGVDSSATLKLLIDRMLIRVLGKREEVGRPMLYGTTKEFLDFFSLGDLRELPTLREYSELTAESRQVMSDRLGIAVDGGHGGNGDGGDGGDDGDSGGNGSGSSGGGDGGGGPAGFGPGGAGSPDLGDDDDGAPVNASADDLADAVATFLSAADAVERSDAAALAPSDDEPAIEPEPEPELDGDADPDPDDLVPEDESAGFADVASNDDRAVERPVMEPNPIEAGALDVEPATE